jgi:D-alanyl-D-alanine carboxypeptidase/D-alanyl-D-alanine-endopeptidase (penicillin-binding protein 4)
VSRLHRLALLTLALLCAVTIGAGAAAARMLPARLAELQVPGVAARALAAPAQVLGPVGAAAPGAGGPGGPGGPARPAGSGAPEPGRAATPAGVAGAVAGVLGSKALGPRVGAVVTDLDTGAVLYARNASSPFTPASTNKLATSVAALDLLGPAARLTTRVVTGPTPASIVLVGGGDPTLAAGRPPAADYPQPATLAELATRTARALRARGRASVRLGYDTSLYSGPSLAPGWSADYVTTGNVSPITSLEVDQGRLTASGAPQDADDPGNVAPRSFDPAPQAAAAFAGFLRRDGIRVAGRLASQVAPRGRATIAAVSSPPLAEILQWMLTESNNVIAENLARQVAIATGRPASFSGAAAAVMATDRRLGVRGISVVDGSGLSPRDKITPDALMQLIRLAAGGPAKFRPVITGLPVAGFSGTLAPAEPGFGTAGRPALGVVRAKTGNLSTVVALAGAAYARNGELLGFAVMADRLPAKGLIPAAAQVVAMASALAGCGCR